MIYSIHLKEIQLLPTTSVPSNMLYCIHTSKLNVMNYLISHIATHTSLLIHPKLSVSSVVSTLCRSDIRSRANNFCSCSGITRTFIKHMFIFIIGITSGSLLIRKIINFLCQMGKISNNHISSPSILWYATVWNISKKAPKTATCISIH